MTGREGGSVMADQEADDASLLFFFLSFAFFRIFGPLFKCFFCHGITVKY